MRVSLYARSFLFAAAIACMPAVAFANHPVLVEGDTDFDGDGLLGTAEDTDNSTDRIFGTLNAALGSLNGGANQNGRITIVTSGRFPEILTITGANGNVTLEAAPGVEANIDAVLAGAAGNVDRQNSTGILIDAANDRMITLRNLVIRNWRDGIVVEGDSHVLIDGCRIEHNLNFGIWVHDDARVAITDCQVSGTGFRVGAAGTSPSVDLPDPGVGIEFKNSSKGLVANTTIAGNYGKGLVKKGGTNVQQSGVQQFDNEREDDLAAPENGDDD
ncbi:MAG: right-handed parallel beta-helix repeat-containing protein [Planctomycetes bacterium]|nr:right-handed parallel beta-helix repeat-containing protein [Planctomycetota bacterium]